MLPRRRLLLVVVEAAIETATEPAVRDDLIRRRRWVAARITITITITIPPKQQQLPRLPRCRDRPVLVLQREKRETAVAIATVTAMRFGTEAMLVAITATTTTAATTVVEEEDSNSNTTRIIEGTGMPKHEHGLANTTRAANPSFEEKKQ